MISKPNSKSFAEIFNMRLGNSKADDNEDAKTTSSPRSPLRPLKKLNRRSFSWSHTWLNTMALHLSSPRFQKTLVSDSGDFPDRTAKLSDQILLSILSRLPESDRKPTSLVCKRWLSLHGSLVTSAKVKDWSFIDSGRVVSRFPNLTHVDLVPASLISDRNSTVLLNTASFAIPVDFSGRQSFDYGCELVPGEEIDKVLSELGRGCSSLKRLVVIGVSELGLLSLGESCRSLTELELHKCSDNLLRGIAACENLESLKLVGNVEGVYYDGGGSNVVSDIGLTILAQGSGARLVRLELSGCVGGFDGIKAIGQGCHLLEELSLCDHRMDAGWMAGLEYCENLKVLRLESCKMIGGGTEEDECFVGGCRGLEKLHLRKCRMRDEGSVRGLFTVCAGVKEIVFQDCWGLDDDTFRLASVCRSVTSLSLEACSLLTTEGLESVILSWKELECLSVVSCKNIKDKDISPSLSTLFSTLKDMKWRPHTKSHLPTSIIGTSLGNKGSRFFRKSRDLKFLFDTS